MKIFTQMAFVLLLGAMVLGGVGCAKGGSGTAITGAALTTNQIDDDSDNKVDEADEARCVCHDDDANKSDGAADKDDSADESAKVDGGARHHHDCECGDGDHEDQHTQTTTTAPTLGK